MSDLIKQFNMIKNNIYMSVHLDASAGSTAALTASGEQRERTILLLSTSLSVVEIEEIPN